MKRALVFLVAAPVLVAISAWLVVLQLHGHADCGDANALATILFFFVLPVSTVTGVLDEYLARAFPILLRLPITAAIGALAATGLAFVLFREFLASSSLPYFTLGGATCAGLCSLFVNAYARAPLPNVHGNSMLRNS
jgi:hypothetical protein